MTQNIHQRIHAAMGDVDYIQKEKKAGMRYSIVSHDAVTGKVRPILHKHGIIYYPTALTCGQDGNRTEVHAVIRFANVDDPADHIDVQSLGYGIDEQDKGPGKAISYAVKYALLKTLGLETGDDPDTDQDVEHAPAPKKPIATAAAPRNWKAIGDHIIGEAAKRKDIQIFNIYLRNVAAEMKAMETEAPAEYARVKGEIAKQKELLGALVP